MASHRTTGAQNETILDCRVWRSPRDGLSIAACRRPHHPTRRQRQCRIQTASVFDYPECVRNSKPGRIPSAPLRQPRSFRTAGRPIKRGCASQLRGQSPLPVGQRRQRIIPRNGIASICPLAGRARRTGCCAAPRSRRSRLRHVPSRRAARINHPVHLPSRCPGPVTCFEAFFRCRRSLSSDPAGGPGESARVNEGFGDRFSPDQAERHREVNGRGPTSFTSLLLGGRRSERGRLRARRSRTART